MKKLTLLFLGALLSINCAFSFDTSLITPESETFKAHFSEAYSTYPNIPKGILEAVAFSYTRIQHHAYTDDSPLSCTGLPRTYGVMGLTYDGKGYFKNNLTYVSVLSEETKEDIMADPKTNILAYAEAYSKLMDQEKVTTLDFEGHKKLLSILSELPNQTVQQDFALNSQLYVMYWFLSKHQFQQEFGFPNYNIDLGTVFGKDNYKVLSSASLILDNEGIETEDGIAYEMKAGPCYEYPGVFWVEADPSNYSSRSGTAISAITIHDMEGTYAGATSWFQNPAANVSAHYNMRSIDGQITQMVCEADKAWHVGTENPYAVGIEHEGKADFQGWYTNIMFITSASLCVDISNQYNIDTKRAHPGPSHYSVTTLGACLKIKGHQHFENSNHRDPGLNWDWDYFYQLMNDATTPTPTTYTAASGTVYDNGGAGANYANDEREFWLIEPTGATEATLTFSQFDLESNWDYLHIYDGNSIHADKIGVYTGTSSPGTITAQSGKFFLEFRSDCATTNPGWTASYTSITTPSSCPQPTNLNQTNITQASAVISWTGSATHYVIRYRDQTYNPWQYINTTSTTYTLTGLPHSSEAYWGVASICGLDTSAFAGNIIETPLINGTFSTSACEGNFRDAGGDEGIYLHNEDWTHTINAGGPITVNFSAFDTEAGYDFLYAYDGNSTAATQFAGSPFSGTTIPANLVSTGNSITFRFDSDNATNADGWDATFTCSGGTPPVTDVTSPTTSIAVPNPWETADYSVAFTDDDESGGSGLATSYWQAADYNGTEWRANASLGFFNDHFDNAIHADWTNTVGTWGISASTLEQSDEVETNTNIYAALTQTSSNSYLYHWTGQINGSGSNRRAGLHFMCDDATQTNRGNSYLVYYRTDSDKCQIYRITTNSIAIMTDDDIVVDPNITYDFKTTYNPTTGVINAYLNDVLVSSWTDPSPITSGNSISLRSGEANYIVDNFKVYHSRGAAETVSIGSASDMIRFQNTSPGASSAKLTSIVADSADNLSSFYSEYYNIDWTSPSIPVTINDGVAADADTQTSTTSLSANWTSSTDQHSGFAKYYYAIGSTSGATDIVNFTDNGTATTITVSGLSLVLGSTYYVSVKAENGAGLQSLYITSDGITIVATNDPPVANFSSSASEHCDGETIQLLNSSTDATTYSWSIPGATPATSTDENPFIEFPSTGTYAIELTATGPGGTDVINQNLTVTVNDYANASATPSSTTVNLPTATVTFTNTSTNATIYAWDFGDGNTSNSEDPSHTYTASGTYTVSLTADGICGPDDIVFTITVIDPGTPPVAGFSSSSNTMCNGEMIQLLNSSTDATSYSWSIPGATPSTSTDENPFIQFPSSGSYSIELTATGPGGTDVITQSISVTASSSPIANAIPSNSVLTLPLANITFTNSSSNATTFIWDFQDGASSTDVNPWHNYTTAGTYNVELVAVNGTCPNDTTYITIVVQSPVGVKEEVGSTTVQLFPNPVEDVFNLNIITSTNEDVVLDVLNVQGKLVNSKRNKIVIGDNNIVLNAKSLNLTKGAYFIKITAGSFVKTVRFNVK